MQTLLSYDMCYAFCLFLFFSCCFCNGCLTLIRIFGGDQVSIIAGALCPCFPGCNDKRYEILCEATLFQVLPGVRGFFNAVLIAIGVSIVLLFFDIMLIELLACILGTVSLATLLRSAEKHVEL